MKDLIEALQIFSKYCDSAWPTGCEHDMLYVYVSPEKVSPEDKETLQGLGFNASDEDDHFYSFRFGSA